MTVNKNIAELIGMAVDDGPEEVVENKVTAAPHEVVIVDNPSLPPVGDLIEQRVVAKKQMHNMAEKCLDVFEDMMLIRDSIEPKFRARYIEIAAHIAGIGLEASKAVAGTTIKEEELRMKQSVFGKTGGQTEKPAPQTTNVFFGSHAEMIQYAEKNKAAAMPEFVETPTTPTD